MPESSMKAPQETLLKAVASRLSEHDFKAKIRDQSFLKLIEHGRVSLHLSFLERGDEFDVTADVAIRFDALEDLVNSDNKALSRAEKADTYTLGAELGNLRDRRQKAWEIRKLSQVEQVASGIYETYLQVAKPYIEKYSKMDAALEVLSRDDQEAWIHCPFHDARAQRAVGLAKLIGMPDSDLQALTAQKEQFLTARNDHGLGEFKLFTDKIA